MNLDLGQRGFLLAEMYDPEGNYLHDRDRCPTPGSKVGYYRWKGPKKLVGSTVLEPHGIEVTVRQAFILGTRTSAAYPNSWRTMEREIVVLRVSGESVDELRISGPLREAERRPEAPDASWPDDPRLFERILEEVLGRAADADPAAMTEKRRQWNHADFPEASHWSTVPCQWVETRGLVQVYTAEGKRAGPDDCFIGSKRGRQYVALPAAGGYLLTLLERGGYWLTPYLPTGKANGHQIVTGLETQTFRPRGHGIEHIPEPVFNLALEDALAHTDTEVAAALRDRWAITDAVPGQCVDDFKSGSPYRVFRDDGTPAVENVDFYTHPTYLERTKIVMGPGLLLLAPTDEPVHARLFKYGRTMLRIVFRERQVLAEDGSLLDILDIITTGELATLKKIPAPHGTQEVVELD